MTKANCNWWQYSRWTYLIGRTVKAQDFSDSERSAVINFIEGIIGTRPALLPRINLKKGDATEIEVQNNYALGKMVQLIGRQLKVLPPTEEEKTFCDELFKVTDPRRYMATAFWYDFEVAVGVPEATVGLYQEDSCVAEAVSDENGNAKFNVKGGVYTVKVDAEGYDQLVSENVTIDSDATFTIESLDPTDYSVTVTVKDSLTTPIEGASVTLGSLPAAQTSAEGIATFSAEVGDYQLTVSKEGYVSYDESVSVTGVNAFDVVLEYAAANFELVFNDPEGSPVSGIDVKVDGASIGTTDSTGKVAANVVPGQHTVAVDATATYEAFTQEVDFQFGQASAGTFSLVYAAVEYTATFHDSEGAVINGLAVKLDGTDAGTTNELGQIVLTAKPGTHTITSDATVNYEAFSQEASFAPGGGAVGPYTVTLKKYQVTFTVNTPESTPAEGIKVTFGAESPVTTEADGLAVFNVKPGTYSVSTEATAAYQAYTEESIEVSSELAKTITLVAIA